MDRAIEVLALALEVSPVEIPLDASIETYDRWDSLAHMRVVSAIEETLERSLETEEMLGVTDLAAIQKILQN